MTATRIDRGSTATTAVYSVDGDLVYERTFDAPRDQVWKAFTDPKVLARWWGRAGSTTTVEEMDVRPGGKWRYVSHDRDGQEYTFYGEYLEVVAPERLKWTFMFDVPGVGPQGGPETMTLEEIGGRTKIVAISHMGSAEALEGALATGMVEGALESYDRLAAELTKR
jgi:uncharacterized protein YndB with AHSA1/START domain